MASQETIDLAGMPDGVEWGWTSLCLPETFEQAGAGGNLNGNAD